MMPSSSPTLITQVAAIFTVTLRLESGLLTDTQVSALENATTSFLQTDVTVASGKLDDIVVQVAGQTVIDVTNVTVATTSNATKSNSTKSKSAKSNSTDRALAATATKSPFFLEQALEIIFSVQSTYTGSDPTLSLHDELVDYFINPDSRWYRWLGAADAVFEPIAPEMTPEEKAVAAAKAAAIAEQESKRQGGNGAVAAASIMSFFALLLGIAAAVFSIRYYRQNNFGQELASPRLTPTSTGLGSRIANENLEYEYSQQMANSSDEANLMKGTKSDEDAGIEVDSATSSWMRPPNSPNSLENGNGVAMDKILQRHRASDLPEQQQLQEQLPPPMQQPQQQQQQQAMDDRWSHIQHSNSNPSRTSKDPPTERSEANFPTRQPMQADPRNMTSLFDNNVR
jgi:hypothetical protein